MNINYNGKELSWIESYFFRRIVKHLEKTNTKELFWMTDREIVLRREKLLRENPNIDPLSPEYPDIDTVRKDWGLKTTDQMILHLESLFRRIKNENTNSR